MNNRLKPIAEILDAARWAPSGDNTQPWRFEIRSDHHVAVHAFDTRSHCVYDLDGHPSQLSVGALLETIRIAATGHRLAVEWARRPHSPDERPVFDVTFVADPSLACSGLIPSIRTRCVQRRAMQRRPIRGDEMSELQASLPPGYTLLWLTGTDRLRVAWLLFSSAEIRLTTREAFEVHRRVIEWNARFSDDRIPDQAVGLNPVMTRFMAWAMHDWRRLWLLNTFFAASVIPRVLLDFVPALACGGHVLILAPNEPSALGDYVAAGAAVQRLWLTATLLGLQHQPEITPLIFARYVRNGLSFTKSRRGARIAESVNHRLEKLVGTDASRRAVWMGRIGAGRPAQARSLRLPVERLLY